MLATLKLIVLKVGLLLVKLCYYYPKLKCVSSYIALYVLIVVVLLVFIVGY